jgi:riboflavin kinase/FMN adenylyltransferase
LGFPTANLSIDPKELPPRGIYAVWARIRGEGRWMGGAASVGFNPTYGLREPQMEVHLLDYGGEGLYGKTLEVLPAVYLREERRYDSSEKLIRQMEKDRENARLALSRCPVPSAFSSAGASPLLPGQAP